jgi:hypothetical protein
MVRFMLENASNSNTESRLARPHVRQRCFALHFT